MGVQGALCPNMPQSVKRAQDGRYSLLTQYKITKRASAVVQATNFGNSSTLSSTRPPKVIKTTASQCYPDPNSNRIQFVDISGPPASSVVPASSCLDASYFSPRFAFDSYVSRGNKDSKHHACQDPRWRNRKVCMLQTHAASNRWMLVGLLHPEEQGP